MNDKQKTPQEPEAAGSACSAGLDRPRYELRFGMALTMRSDLENNMDWWARNAWRSWRSTLEGKTYHLVGWNESGYAIVENLGDYGFEYIGGHPAMLFDAV